MATVTHRSFFIASDPIIVHVCQSFELDIAPDHRWHWTYLYGKKNTGQKSLSFLGLKIWSTIGLSIKDVRTTSPFMHVIKKNILLHLQN